MAATRVDGVYVPESFSLESKDKAKFNKDVKKIRKTRKGDSTRGVVYVGHIPAGFYEPQMKRFFAQFGRITRLRLSRSKKTGHSKGYAFIEFYHQEVAKVVADTMNNYLMFMRLLKCEFVSPEKVHPDTFKGCNKKFAVPKAAAVAAQRHNSEKNETQEKRRQKRQAKKLKKFADLGIDLGQDTEIDLESPLPEVVETSIGALQVLKEDASDTEVTFKTPPGSIKSSRLAKKKRKVKRLK